MSGYLNCSMSSRMKQTETPKRDEKLSERAELKKNQNEKFKTQPLRKQTSEVSILITEFANIITVFKDTKSK